jgi:hypothetical protein
MGNVWLYLKVIGIDPWELAAGGGRAQKQARPTRRAHIFF